MQSTLGKGSVFWFTARLQRGRGIVPAEIKGPIEACDAEGRLRSEFSGARILLAEDHPVNREVALELLHGAGLDIDTATNGREAWEKAQANDYDLILMDMQMPQMDGREATRAIRRLPGRADVPILAITANAFDEDRLACKEAGMNDFITKPFDPAGLYQNLLLWLELARNHPQMELFVKEATPKSVPVQQAGDVVSAHELELRRGLEDRLASLANLPGLNLPYGLAALRNNARKYLDLLEKFVGLHAENMIRLSMCLAENDWAGAQALAHGLKGTAGTLGAERLAALAERVEVRLRSAEFGEGGVEDLHPQLEAIDVELKEIAKALASAADVVREPVKSTVPENVDQVLGLLDSLLAANDTEVLTVVEEHAVILQAALGPAWEGVGVRINRFEFEAALQLLRGLRAKNPNRI